jgi:hypothetical protein
MIRARTLRQRSRLLVALAAAACWSSACSTNSAIPADAGSDAGAPPDAGDAGGPDAGLPDGGVVTSDAGVGVIVTVSNVVPAQGPVSGGTLVLVTGAGFVQGFASSGGGAVSAVTHVSIGGVAATSVNVIDDNRLQATTPAGTPGAADLRVVNPNGSGTCAGCFRYLTHVEVDAIAPASGDARGGTTVAITGKGFTSDLTISIGGAPLLNLAIVSDTRATGLTPPGAIGPAEVAATSHEGRGSKPGAFSYQTQLSVADVQPRLVPTAGGTTLAILGAGFSAQATVQIGGAPSSSFWIDASHLSAIAPAHAAGAVAVTVTDPGALGSGATPPSFTLARGLVYGDPAATLPGPLALESLSPQHGPLAGGLCPTACLALYGSGFTVGDLAVSIGGAAVPGARVHVANDQTLTLDLPPGAQAGPVDVSVSSASEAMTSTLPASDPGAFHYDPMLGIATISPTSAPASGTPGTAITLTGSGFDQSAGAPLEVRIGALDATHVVVASDGTSLTATAPAGAAGLADVLVIATDPGGAQRTATLANGFTFLAPVSILQVSPSSGSQAGGESVTLYGSGFLAGMHATFGGNAASSVSVRSSTLATAIVPAGTPGAVDVAVSLETAALGTDSLHAGFTYYDPTSRAGGASGEVLQGTLNVTVRDGTNGGGLADANVEVTLHDGSKLSGITNAKGQLTFSDPRLVLSVAITAGKPTYNTITAASVAVENVTLYLFGPSTIIIPPPSDAGPPPPPKTAKVGGHVYGFKVPPTLVLNANQRVVAYVRITPTSIYAGAPFSSPGAPIVVAQEGGGYAYLTTDLAPFGIYAELGVETNLGQNLTSFKPFLLGVVRAVQPDPNNPVTNADIILDTHLDQTVVATLVSPPDPGPGNTLQHLAAVDLDLGSAGLIPLSSSTSTGNATVEFTSLPSAEGQGFIFIDAVSNGSAESVYLRRVFSDVSSGVMLGPYLPFPLLIAPVNHGPAFDGLFSWSISDGLQPNLQQLRLDATLADKSSVSWAAVLPGDARSIELPASVRAQLPSGTVAAWTLTGSYAPGFVFDYWTYYDLGGTGWITYAYGFNQFTVP